MDLDRAMEYLEFVHERHNVWERRRAGDPQPWTSDPVLAGNKFTNVFRVLDYGSQFLLKELLDPSLPSRDILARCLGAGRRRRTGPPGSGSAPSAGR